MSNKYDFDKKNYTFELKQCDFNELTLIQTYIVKYIFILIYIYNFFQRINM